MTSYRFAFRSTFAGTANYDVFDGRQSIGQVSVTYAPLSDYWRKNTNNPAQAESALNILRWSGLLPGSALSAPVDMVEAFNAWQVAEYDAAKLEAARKWPDEWRKYFPAPSAPATLGRFDANSGLWEAVALCEVAA